MEVRVGGSVVAVLLGTGVLLGATVLVLVLLGTKVAVAVGVLHGAS